MRPLLEKQFTHHDKIIVQVHVQEPRIKFTLVTQVTVNERTNSPCPNGSCCCSITAQSIDAQERGLYLCFARGCVRGRSSRATRIMKHLQVSCFHPQKLRNHATQWITIVDNMENQDVILWRVSRSVIEQCAVYTQYFSTRDCSLNSVQTDVDHERLKKESCGYTRESVQPVLVCAWNCTVRTSLGHESRA